MPNTIPSAKRRYDLILSTLRDMLRQLMGTDLVEIEADRSLIELGADSLLLLQASQRIREKFDVRIPFRSLMEELSTLDAIASYLEPRLPADFAVTPGQAAVPGARPEQNGIPKAKNETEPVLLPSMVISTKTASDPLMAPPSFHQLERARPEEDSAESQMIRADQDDAGSDAVQQIIRQQLQISEQQLRLMSLQLELLRNGNLSYEEVDRSESWRSDPGHQPLPPLNHDPAPPTQAANSAPEAVAETLSAPAGTTMKREAFVAYRPINKSSGHDLTERQRQDLDALISRVVKKTQGSRRVAQSVRPYLANNRVVSGFRLLWKEMQYPLVVDRASGSRLWDIDGNEYVDCTMGFGALLFGHSPSFLINAMQRQLERGIQLGAESELAGQAAALICELTGAERVAFCNSGTEAVMSALRLARAVTGRTRIALFESCYHGTFDGTMVRGRNGANGQLQTAPLAPGVPEHMIENVLLLKLDDPKSLDILRSQAKTLAAVLVEPMPSRFPDLRPEVFLRELRTITAEAGAALIFDEVVTGFRFHPGGVQSLFGIQADLVAYGKAAGAGIPIGIIAGKSRYMDAIDGGEWNYGDDSYPEAEITFITGTYFRHPLTMSAVVAVLNEVKALGPELQEALRHRTSRLADTLNAMFEESSFPAQIVNSESLFRFVFSPEMKFADLFYYYLLEKGVYICETRNCLLSSAHTDEDIDFIVQAVRETIAEMRAGDWAPPQECEPASFCPAPSTEAQKELWALSQMGEHISRAYNESYILRLKGRFDPGALRNALQGVVNRHEALRTTFDEEGAVQRIQTAGSIDLQFTDLSLLEGEERERQAGERCARDVQQVFDLVRGPLLRARIIKLERDFHIVVLVLHHIITDGVSIGIMMQELASLYEAYSGGKSHSLPEPVPFRDYIKWLAELQNSGRMTEAEDFWLAQFADQFPMLDLPADRPRPSLPTYAGAQVQTTLNRSAAEALKNLGARQNCTLFATLLAGYAALLHRLSGRKDMVMGIPVAGQSIMGGGPLLGYCVNFVPFRCSIDGDMRFADFLRSVKKRWLDAYSHSIYPLSRLTKRLGLKRDPARISPIPMGFNLDRSESLDLFGLESEVVFTAPDSSRFDLSLNATETDEGLELCLDYNTDLFEAETAQRWLRHLTALLEAVIANPNSRISELQFLSAVERQQLLVDWNRTATDYPRQTTLNNLFELGVKAHPERIALVYGDQSLTYHELNARANQLARHLWRRGVGSETLVGICVERSLEMMVGILGILKAGGAYVPMDPAYPAERIAFMLEDAGVRVLLTQQPMLKGLPASRAEVIALDVEWRKIGAESEENPPSRATAENLAYVIYTSGSTGRPKGVLAPHRQVINFFTAMDVYLRTGPEAVWMAMASISFDMSVLELLWTLAHGFRVVVNERRLVEPATRPVETKNVNGRSGTGDEELSIMARMARYQVSHLQCTPSLANILSLEADGLQGINSLQQLLIGGEAFPGELAENLRELLKAEIHNMYGPTETTVWSAAYPVNGAERTIPIGRPIANNRIYILDERLENVPVGVSGELYIGGEGVVRGYLERAELTAERFLPDAFSPELGVRFYRTGDLARYRKDGQIEFLGRIGDQVKIRGYRIEPGEIEAVCTEHPEVKEAVVLARQRENGGQRLVAYLVAKEGAVLSDSQIRGYLEKRLPDYMVPSAIVLLDEMPLNTNGKIDRGRLPQPELDRERSEREYRQPATETEQALAQIWEAVLQVPKVGAADNFFELGGDSIIAVQISARARQAGLHLTPNAIFEHRTIAKLAATIENSARKTVDQGSVAGALPLTPIQRWFFEQHLPEPHHFNQSILLELKRPLETAVIERALSALITHHDALRSRFVKEPEGWRGFIAEPETGAPLTEIDLSGTPTSEMPAAIERRCGEMQASLNLAEGPIIRVGFLRLGQNRGDRLFITIHHLAVDIASWGILLEDLATACDHASRGEEIRLLAKTISFKRWGELLTELGQKEESEEALDFWLAEKRRSGGDLPVDHADGNNIQASARTVIVELDEEERRRLVHEVPKAYRTQISEVLLAALGTALGEWNGEGKLLVDVEGHGREESVVSEADLTRTVGWFTSIYPVVIEAGTNPGETLKRVKEEMREGARRGLMYGVLKYLGRAAVAEKIRQLPQAQICFNFMSQFGGQTGEFSVLEGSDSLIGLPHSPEGHRPYLLEINGAIFAGRLRLSWTYSEHVHDRTTIEKLTRRFKEALRSLMDHCVRDRSPLSPTGLSSQQVAKAIESVSF